MRALLDLLKKKFGEKRRKSTPLSRQEKSGKRLFVLGALFVTGVAILLLPSDVRAQTTVSVNNWLVQGLGTVAQLAVEFLGKLLIAIIDMLVKVAQYNDFGDSDAVNIGWVVARDVANMLFIVSLIVISFGTILQWEQYRYNRLLGKLVITAVIVNFSKAITLFLIDFSQVIMLTFVNAFKDVAAGNLTTGFGIRALLSYSESSTSVDINLESTVLVYALAVILLLVAGIVTLTLVVILLRRIISLWIIIILSPLAFISSIMPGGVGDFNSQWWKRLGTELFVGPALAFFLWLTFSIIFLTSGQGASETATIVEIGGTNGTVIESSGEVQATVSQIGSTRNLFNFITAIVLLIHSMSIAKTASGFAGKFAGRASGWIDKGGAKLAKGIGRAPKKLSDWTGATGVAKRAGFTAADSTLGLLSKAPIVGNRLAVARGRLAGRRKRSEEQDKRDLANVSKDALMRMANGSARTERGRALRKGAMEYLIDSGDPDDLNEKARLDYRKYIGYQERVKESVDENGNKIYKLDRNARDQAGYQRVKAMTKSHMEYWYDGFDQKDDKLQMALRNKYKSEVNKLRRNTWTSLDPDAVKKDTIVSEESRRHLWDGWHDQFGFDQSKWPKWFEEFDKTKKDFFSGARPDGLSDEDRARKFEREKEARERLGIGDPKFDPRSVAGYANERVLNGPPEEKPENWTPIQKLIEDRIRSGEKPEDVAKSYAEYQKHIDDLEDKDGIAYDDGEYKNDKEWYEKWYQNQELKNQYPEKVKTQTTPYTPDSTDEDRGEDEGEEPEAPELGPQPTTPPAGAGAGGAAQPTQPQEPQDDFVPGVPNPNLEGPVAERDEELALSQVHGMEELNRQLDALNTYLTSQLNYEKGLTIENLDEPMVIKQVLEDGRIDNRQIKAMLDLKDSINAETEQRRDLISSFDKAQEEQRNRSEEFLKELARKERQMLRADQSSGVSDRVKRALEMDESQFPNESVDQGQGRSQERDREDRSQNRQSEQTNRPEQSRETVDSPREERQERSTDSASAPESPSESSETSPPPPPPDDENSPQ